MVYTFALIKHANIRYRDSVCRLGKFELQSMLRSLSVDCDIISEEAGGAAFLTFECRPLSPEEISFLSGHSSLSFLAEKTPDGLFRPLSFSSVGYLPEDLPEVLKYKGKTSVSFTRMMLNVALSVSSFAHSESPLTVLDPLCGKGTTCFTAVQSGMNAIGLDLDRKAVREAVDYFSRYLKFHQMKHTMKSGSETCGSTSVPYTDFVFADSKDHFLNRDTRTLRLAVGDTSLSPSLTRHSPVHLMIADLPYGIQHAPQSGQKPETFVRLLTRSLPVWRQSLAPGGVLALSFNTLTLPTDCVISLVERSGLIPCRDDIFTHLRHEVEQAVVRDVVFAVNTP